MFKYFPKTIINFFLFSGCVFMLLLLFSWDSTVEVYKNHKHVRFKNILSNPKRLINLNNFKYIINNKRCNENYIKGILIVTSYAGDPQGRSAHRRALPDEQLWDINFKRVFLLANIPKEDKYAITQEALINENERFHDIIQGNFDEAYRNLTYKHIMGLKWASENCGQVEYIIKMDDDIIIDIYGILNILNRNKQPKNLLMGYILKNMQPKRDPINKWFVKESEYASNVYPTFLSGWLYITNPYTARLLVAESNDVPYFWIDDVYVTGILAESLYIKHQSINKYYTVHPENIECCINDWKKYNYKCDYLICTNGNDFNLFVKYAKLALDCNKLNKCLDRPDDKNIDNTCVAHRHTNPINKGEPIIQMVKL